MRNCGTLLELREQLALAETVRATAGVPAESFRYAAPDYLVLAYPNVRAPRQRPGESPAIWLGWYLSMCADEGSGPSVQAAIPESGGLDAALEALYAKLRQQCRHPRTRALNYKECRARGWPPPAACYHVYECLACGSMVAEDSSD
jgi:hypothetical protein